MFNEKVQSINIEKDTRQLLGFSPAGEKDWKKLEKITEKVELLWGNAGLELETFAGLYFSAVGFSDLLELRADHAPGVDVPEKVINYLDGITVNLKKDGEKVEK